MSPALPKISIIMPAYNVDRYVRRAVESLQHQRFEDWELLAVDDGSTDRTGQILDSIADRDIRVTVIHQDNAGAPAARNNALDRARGTYVMFMDADDWAEPQMLGDMVRVGDENDLELVVSGFYIDTYYGSADQHTSEVKNCPDRIFETQQEFRAAAWRLFDANQLYPPWNKLFRRDRIERIGLRFRPTFWDDFPFVLDYIRDVEKVGVISRPYYHFIRQRSESETARWRPDMYDKREEEHGWMLDLYRHWGLEGDPASMEMVQRRYIERRRLHRERLQPAVQPPRGREARPDRGHDLQRARPGRRRGRAPAHPHDEDDARAHPQARRPHGLPRGQVHLLREAPQHARLRDPQGQPLASVPTATNKGEAPSGCLALFHLTHARDAPSGREEPAPRPAAAPSRARRTARSTRRSRP